MIRILAAVPVYHAVEPEPFLNFLSFSQRTGQARAEGLYSVRWCVPGPKMGTITARNVATGLALDGEADYLLLIDDDMVVPRNLLDRLLLRDVDIISPIFFRSNPPIDPLVYDVDETGVRVPYYDYPKSAIFEVPGGMGTGVMLIKTAVLNAMDFPVWHGNEFGVEEDILFCERAQKLGFKTWCDSTVEIKQMSCSVAIGSEAYEMSRLT